MKVVEVDVFGEERVLPATFDAEGKLKDGKWDNGEWPARGLFTDNSDHHLRAWPEKIAFDDGSTYEWKGDESCKFDNKRKK